MKKILQRLRSLWFAFTAPRIIRSVLTDSLTFLDRAALRDIYQYVQSCERRKLDGILIEAGCAAGGSAIVITAAKGLSRQLLVYDVFGMIPAPSNKDGEDVLQRYNVIKQGNAKGIGSRGYYGYEPDLLEQVEQNFSKHGFSTAKNNVMLVKGLFSDTIIGTEPVALAHLDGDWYDSVLVCLQRIVPRLVVGGILVIDDYDAWSRCRKAVDEYFADKIQDFKFVKKCRLNIIRLRRRN